MAGRAEASPVLSRAGAGTATVDGSAQRKAASTTPACSGKRKRYSCGSGASPDGQGEDDFVFRISREEFMNYFFDDLALPRRVPDERVGSEWEWGSTGRTGRYERGSSR